VSQILTANYPPNNISFKLKTQIMKKLLLSISLTVIALCNVSFAQSKIKAIRAGKLIDVLNGTILSNQIILIDSNKIVDVGSSIVIPQNAEVIH
jgi:hypothetical protein